MSETGFGWADFIGVVPERYQLKRPLGRGGFGTVILAWDTQLQRWCAIKVARDATKNERLIREARFASALQGPHTVRIFDADLLESGAPYVVMEYLEGQTVAQRLAASGKVPWRSAVAWMEQVCLGLEEAHRAGLVHRDIKPSNLHLASDAVTQRTIVKVLDFGLARPIEHTQASRTDSNVVIGSPAYMSPEQIRNRDVGPLSDIWSVGVVLYQLLTGHLPFSQSTNVAILAAIAADPPEPLELIEPALPARLVHIVERCLSKCPEDRFGSAAELSLELNALLSQQAAEREEPSLDTLELSVAAPQMTRTRGRSAGALMFGLGLVALALVGIVAARQIDGAQRTTARASAEGVEVQDPGQLRESSQQPIGVGLDVTSRMLSSSVPASSSSISLEVSGEPEVTRLERQRRPKVSTAKPSVSSTPLTPQPALFDEPDF